MENKIMKTLTIGETTYEIVDEQARNDIENLKNSNPLRITEITLLAESWITESNWHYQIVDINGITAYSQVDLTPSIEQLAIFYDKDLTFVTENENGVVTVYAIGSKPTNDYTIQVTIKEVDV